MYRDSGQCRNEMNDVEMKSALRRDEKRREEGKAEEKEVRIITGNAITEFDDHRRSCSHSSDARSSSLTGNH